VANLKVGEPWIEGMDMQPTRKKSDSAQAHFQQGIVYQERGQMGAAVASYQQALRLLPQETDADLDRLLIYNNLGCALTTLGQYDRAMAAYRQAEEIDSEYAPLYHNLGQLWLTQGELDQAIAAYQRSLELNPHRVLTAYNLGKVFQRQQRHTEAVSCFQKVLQLEPTHPQVLGDCGLSLLEVGQFSEAAIYLRQAIAQQPEWVETYCHNMAQLVPQNDLDRARFASGQLLRSLQQQADASEFKCWLLQIYRYLGRVHFQSGWYNPASKYYQKAMAIASASPLRGIVSASANKSLEPEFTQLRQEWQVCQFQQQRIQKLIFGGEVPGKELPNSVYLSVREWCAFTPWERAEYRPVSAAVGKRASPPQSPNSAYPQCEGLNCAKCLKRIADQLELTRLEEGIYTYANPRPLEGNAPDTFVATVPEGRAWIMPQENWWRVCEAIAIVSPDRYLLADVSREYPGQLPGCDRHDPRQHRIFRQDALPPVERIEGTVAIIAGLSANVYFHWMVDILPRIEILRQGGWKWEQIDRFVVNQCRQPFQRETLTRLGIPEYKIIESDRHPHIQADRLIVPSFGGDLGLPSPWVIEFLRQTFLKENVVSTPSPERIYISRSKAGYRRLFNEAEVVALLQDYGFVSVALEDLSLDEQINLFRNAKAIVAPHGSGFTNILFCQPGTQVVELVSPHYFRHYFGTISQQLGLKHYYLVGEPFHCSLLRTWMYVNPLIADIVIDLNSLRKILEKLGIVKSRILMTDTTVIPRQREKIMPPMVQSEQTAAHYQQRAEALLAQGKLDDAIAACQEALKSDPRSASACKTLGNIWRAKGDLPQARSWYQKATTLNPTYAEAYANLGNIATQQQDWQPAVAYFQKAIALKPDFAGAYQHLSKVWQKLGRELESTDCLYRAYELDSHSVKPESLLNLGNRLFKQDRLTQAIACYQKALKLNPNLSGAYHNLAEALTRQGRLQEANALYRQASRLSLAPPSSPAIDPQDQLSVSVATPSPSRAISANTEIVPPATVHEPSEAIWQNSTASDFLEQVQQTQQDIETAYQQLGRALKRQEELHREALRFQETILQLVRGKKTEGTALRNGATLHPNQAMTALHNLGASPLKNLFDGTWSNMDLGVEGIVVQPSLSSADNFANNRLSSEELDLLDGSRSLQMGIDAKIGQAQEACSRGDFQQAIALCQEVIQVQPKAAISYNVLGEALQGMGKLSEAEQQYKRAISLQPQEVSAYLNLGNLYVQQQQWKPAILVSQKAMKINPRVAEPHERLGDILKFHDRLDGAVRYYQAALALDPEAWKIYHKLGDTLQAQGKIDEAIVAYQKATELANHYGND
jgi:tetratricopeptide (TPR) repeat protein/capsular polysaccharide biosynthesis protein